MLATWREEVVQAIRAAARGVTPPSHATLAVEADWFPLFADTLMQHIELPGIREARAVTVRPAYTPPTTKNTTLLGADSVDARLHVLLHHVHNLA